MVKAFFISLIMVGLAGAGWYFVGTKSSVDGAQIIFKGPDAIFYGVPFDISLGVGNNAGGAWNNVELSLSLPEGFVLVNGGSASSFAIKQLGNVSDGSLTEVTFPLIAVQVSDASSAEPIRNPFEATLAYTPGGTATVFKKKERWQGPTPKPGIALELTAPEKIVGGEELPLKVTYANTTESAMDGLSLHLSYPEGFVLTKATVEADMTNDTWNIGAVRAGSQNNIVLFGRLEHAGTNDFEVTMTRAVNGSRQNIQKARVTVVSQSSPLTVAIDTNDTPDFVARLGETIAYTIAYIFEKSVEGASGNITVRATLDGQLFDRGSAVIHKGGVMRRDPKTGAPQIVWQIANTSVEGGSVEFTIAVKNDYNIKRLGDRDFTLHLRAEAEAGKVTGFAENEIKIDGKIMVEARGFFRDAPAGIMNKGALPPKVGAPTEYTIHWSLKNYATDVRKISVRAKLEPGVRFTGVVKSTVDTKPTYDAASGEVLWNMERISATTGLMGAGPEVIFQIEGTPSSDRAGKPMPLMGPTTVSATDNFTGRMISGSAPEITTVLPDDATVGNTGVVIP